MTAYAVIIYYGLKISIGLSSEMQQLVDKVNYLYSEQIRRLRMENSVSIAPAHCR